MLPEIPAVSRFILSHVENVSFMISAFEGARIRTTLDIKISKFRKQLRKMLIEDNGAKTHTMAINEPSLHLRVCAFSEPLS